MSRRNRYLYEKVDAFLKKKIGARKSLERIKQILHTLYNNPITGRNVLKEKITENLVNNGYNPVNSDDLAASSVHLVNLTPQEILDKVNHAEPHILLAEEYAILMLTGKFREDSRGQYFADNTFEKQPTFNFFDGSSFYNGSSKQKGVKHLNDVAYYTSPETGTHFAKVVKLRYSPIDKDLVSEHIKKDYNKTDEYIYRNPNLYKSSYSISFYTFLNGNPDKAHLLVRYDSTSYDHQNLWIIDDEEKRSVFGDVAKSPHFHFQNENDDLICLRKENKGGEVNFKTGGCNAIDCEHLAEYLYQLDSKDSKSIKQLIQENKNFDMPFLYLKGRNVHLNLDLDFMLTSYAAKINNDQQGYENMKYFYSMINKFKTNYNKSKYANMDSKSVFSEYIFTLKLLEFIDEAKKSVTDLEKFNTLHDFEVILSNKLFENMLNIEISYCKVNVNDRDIDDKEM